jgi:hypothetical protein
MVIADLRLASHYLLGWRTAPSGVMFLGGRVDDAISTYYTRILEHHEQLTIDQVKDAYRDHWQRELAAEQDKLGIQWDPELDEAESSRWAYRRSS